MYIAETGDAGKHVFGCTYPGCDRPVRIVDCYRNTTGGQKRTTIEFECDAGPLHYFTWVFVETSGQIALHIRSSSSRVWGDEPGPRLILYMPQTVATTD